MPLATNTLYYGDNLQILRDYLPDESVDLIYLDPPFNSNRSYNVLFKETTSASSAAQIGAFDDTWHWGEAAQQAYEQIALHGTDDTARLLQAMVDALKRGDVTAYLAMMAIRLVELRRVLKPTGSIYLHCDPTASHYLKVLMDSIFGPTNFRNEITWERTTGRKSGNQFGRVHDVLLFYTRSDKNAWNAPRLAQTAATVRGHDLITDADGVIWRYSDLSGAGQGPVRRFGDRDFPPPAGRHWQFDQPGIDGLWRAGRIVFSRGGQPRLRMKLDELEGVDVRDVWTDIRPINASAAERLGYPTQKPLALLERIISASSNPGDIVLDPFCGCGTAVHAAQKLGRQWVGIDITHLAIGLIRRRMDDAFPELAGKINVVGEPVDLTGAAELAARDPYQFQWWSLDRLGALPAGDGGRKKGMDRGIDGIIPFVEGATERRRVIISVKAGNLSPSFVRDLKGVLEREGEPIGVLVTLKAPTREMRTEAVAAGSYHSEFWDKDYPKIQIITAEDLLNGAKVAMPQQQASPFAQAPRERRRGKQESLDL